MILYFKWMYKVSSLVVTPLARVPSRSDDVLMQCLKCCFGFIYFIESVKFVIFLSLV